jgi:hypothetical protein
MDSYFSEAFARQVENNSMLTLHQSRRKPLLSGAAARLL